MTCFTPADDAEAITAFGEALGKLVNAFDDACKTIGLKAMEQVNAIENQEHLTSIADAFRQLGNDLSQEVAEAEEADDRRRSNPLEPDFRRL